MKIFMILLLSISTVQAQNKAYDKKLADSLGADEYGMKMYSLVILKSGSFKTEDKILQDSLFRGHMNNINKLASSGKLVVAGPLGKNDKQYRGIFILNTQTVEEAKSMLAGDAAIAAGLFDVEIFPWYGSAALPTYLPLHEKVELKKP